MVHLQARTDGLDPSIVKRLLTTASCTDSDSIPKVSNAGECEVRGGVAVQVMHNGVVVVEDCYYGAWMTELIRVLRGHHEPQEEAAFDIAVGRLAATSGTPVMVELGSFWAYYSLWFCQALPDGRVIALEPDPANMAVGRRNAALNGFEDRITFVEGAVGDRPGELIALATESDRQVRELAQYDLAALMKVIGVESVDLVLCDVQGAELVLLQRALPDFKAGRVRFVVVSTHHRTFSDDPLTHQKALALLSGAGAHVICEHTVSESFSGDGLIVASFAPEDRDLSVELSRARSQQSLFGEPEFELDDALRGAAELEADNRVLRFRIAELTEHLNDTCAENYAMRATKVWRWASAPRSLYGRLRRGIRSRS